MATLLAAAIAILAAFNAYALYKFLKSREALKNSAQKQAAAAPAAAQTASLAAAGKAASNPLALKQDLRAIEEELLSLRVRLNNHEATHLPGPEYASASGELSQISTMLQKAKAENFSQITQVAVELSAINERLAMLEEKYGDAPQNAQNAQTPQGAQNRQIPIQ